eukprot:scaffold222776_cov28-Tisochrysis_lutea.AAC.1
MLDACFACACALALALGSWLLALGSGSWFLTLALAGWWLVVFAVVCGCGSRRGACAISAQGPSAFSAFTWWGGRRNTGAGCCAAARQRSDGPTSTKDCAVLFTIHYFMTCGASERRVLLKK